MGGGSAYIDHADAIGSTVMETDPSGAVDWDVAGGADPKDQDLRSPGFLRA